MLSSIYIEESKNRIYDALKESMLKQGQKIITSSETHFKNIQHIKLNLVCSAEKNNQRKKRKIGRVIKSYINFTLTKKECFDDKKWLSGK